MVRNINRTFLSSFSTELKISVLSLVFEKDGALKTKNYSLVSVLPVVSKIFTILLNKWACASRMSCAAFHVVMIKWFSAQQVLLSLLENWKIVVDRKRYAAAILMDLCKALNNFNHYHLAAHRNNYSFSEESNKSVENYLSNCWQSQVLAVGLS